MRPPAGPQESSEADSATVTIADNDSLSVSLEPPPTVLMEGDTAHFVVTLSGPTPNDLVVSYATASGSAGAVAAAGADYTAVSGTLTFSSSDSALSQTIAVATIDDDLNEASETFTVRLTGESLPMGVSPVDTTVAATIIDDDGLTASVTADAPIVAEGDPATFTVALAGGTSTGDVVVAYSVAGTATAGDDYTAPDGTLTIEMGEASGADHHRYPHR